MLLSYEYEANTAARRARSSTTRPDDTIKIDIALAVTEKAAPRAEVRRLRALQAGPGEVRRPGLPPVNQEVFEANKSKFPDPAGLFMIDDLGGWSKVNDQLFDPEKGSVAKIKEEAGVSTAS